MAVSSDNPHPLRLEGVGMERPLTPLRAAAADSFLVAALLAALGATVMRGFHGNAYHLFSRYCLLWIEFFVPAAVFLGKKDLRGSGVFAFALFPLWFALCCLYHGVSLTVAGEAQAALVHLTSVALIAFPFAELTGDGRRRKILDAVLLAGLIVFALMLLIAFYGVFRGACFSLWHGRLRFGATYSATGRLELRVLLWHQYCTAFLAMACCLSIPYVLASRPRRCFYVPAAVLELIFLAAVALGASRNAMLALMAGFACIAAIGIRRSSLPVRTKKFVFAAVCVLLLFFGAFSMNFIYRNVTHSIRTIWYGLTTLTSRIEIWGAVPKMLRDRPEALLWGLPYVKLMSVLNGYIPLEGDIAHMHSGYVHTLCGMGVPGGALASAYTVPFFRDFFTLVRAKPESGISATDQLLAVVPFSIWCVNLLEPELFLPGSSMLSLNVLFALLCGYLRCTARANRS